MKIDATEVVKALGIKRMPEVTFGVCEGSETACGITVSDESGTRIRINMEVIDDIREAADDIRRNNGCCPCGCGAKPFEGREPQDFELANVLVHELTHVKQMEDAGSWRAAAQEYDHENEMVGYANNPFELEAVEMGRKLKHLVKVIA